MTPVPFENTPVRLDDPPEAIVVGFAVKLSIPSAPSFAAFTVTVAVWLVVAPAELVTVSV
jgi:hypothetical protein